jgi:hypothetical protein
MAGEISRRQNVNVLRTCSGIRPSGCFRFWYHPPPTKNVRDGRSHEREHVMPP